MFLEVFFETCWIFVELCLNDLYMMIFIPHQSAEYKTSKNDRETDKQIHVYTSMVHISKGGNLY